MQVNEVYVGATLYHKGRYGMYRKVEKELERAQRELYKFKDGAL